MLRVSLKARLVLEKMIFKYFTIYGHDGYLNKWPVAICTHFQSHTELKKFGPVISEEFKLRADERMTDDDGKWSQQLILSLWVRWAENLNVENSLESPVPVD